MSSANTAQRIDRWIFYTRFYKTRTLAKSAVVGGHVKINGERAAPGTRVRCEDVIELLRDRLVYQLTVTAIPSRRGPAAEARACYTEDPEFRERRLSLQDELRRDRLLMPKTAGRPDKHTRKKIRQKNRNEC